MIFKAESVDMNWDNDRSGLNPSEAREPLTFPLLFAIETALFNKGILPGAADGDTPAQ